MVGRHETATGMQAEMISLGSTTTIHWGEWLKLTGARRGWELMSFIPNVKRFFSFTLLASWEHLFWPLSGFVYKPNCLGALESCTVGSVCLFFLSCHSCKKKSEIWTLMRSLIAWHPPLLLWLQHPHHFASNIMFGASGGNTEPLLLNPLTQLKY